MTKVTVFGGSKPTPGEPAYEEAYRLGQLLGKAGCTVLTGGYIGTMEAVSRGAAEAGTHVIGITCTDIENYRPGQANGWVMEEIHVETLQERIFRLIEACDAALALPGGAGTLTEIAVMWNHMLVGAIPTRPLILIGPGWNQGFGKLFASLDGYFLENHRKLLSFAPDVDAAYQCLQEQFRN